MSTSKILEKWRAQQQFIRFIDGNTNNNTLQNLEWITIKEAMQHFDDWVFDWDMDLTKKEKKMVLNPEWRAGLFFR